MASYSDINRGLELKEAYDNLLLWRAKSRAAKQAAYRAVAKPVAQRVKTERMDGYILPFNSQTAGVYLQTRVLNTTQAGVGSATAGIVRGLVNDRFKTDIATLGTAENLRVPKFRFAKIIASERTDVATSPTPSRKTDTPYLRHRSNNISCPFGKATAADNYSAALAEIKGKPAFETFEQTAGNRIGFTAEG